MHRQRTLFFLPSIIEVSRFLFICSSLILIVSLLTAPFLMGTPVSEISESLVSPLNEKKERLFQRNHIRRSYNFAQLMGITENGINPRKYDIPIKDVIRLNHLSKVYSEATELLFPIDNVEYLHTKKISKNRFRSIPKKIHFIWLGPKEFPEESLNNVAAWRKKHPNWQIYFWTDSPDRPLPEPSMIRRLVDSYHFGAVDHLIDQTNNWGEKSDLMRYAILQREGGIYVDHDIKCEKKFDIFVANLDFFCALERLHYHISIDSFVHPANGIIGSIAQHPIFTATMKYILAVWDDVIIDPLGAQEAPIQQVIRRTYDSFASTTMRLARFDPGRKDLLLPSSYFYSKKVFNKTDRSQLKKDQLFFADHTYAGSWKTNESKKVDNPQ